ncbi:hypothetical protein AHAS_Ahas02G0102800 [Arachis hypogaea]
MNPNLFCSEKRSCTLSTKPFLQTSLLDYSNFVSTDTTTSKEEVQIQGRNKSKILCF